MWMLFLLFFIEISSSDGKLIGDHVCTTEITYPKEFLQWELKNKTTRTYTWCMNVPPRCSVYSTKILNETWTLIRNVTENVEQCCEGFKEKSGECISLCENCTHGLCIKGKCICKSGWIGNNCEFHRVEKNSENFKNKSSNKNNDKDADITFKPTSDILNEAPTIPRLFPISTENDSSNPELPEHSISLRTSTNNDKDLSSSYQNPLTLVTTEFYRREYSGSTKNIFFIKNYNRYSEIDVKTTTEPLDTAATDAESLNHPTVFYKASENLNNLNFQQHSTSFSTSTNIDEDIVSLHTNFETFSTTESGERFHTSTGNSILKSSVETSSINIFGTTKTTIESTTSYPAVSTNLQMEIEIIDQNTYPENDHLSVFSTPNIYKTKNVLIDTTFEPTTSFESMMFNRIGKSSMEIINKEDEHTEVYITDGAISLKPILLKKSTSNENDDNILENSLEDESRLESSYKTLDKNTILTNDRSNKNLIYSVCAAMLTTVLILVVAIIFFALRNARKKLEKSQGRKDVAHVAVYTTSIFHTPLPDPPTFENPTYISTKENQIWESRKSENIEVQDLVFQKPLRNPKMDSKLYLYDHPPSTGSYRASSEVDTVSQMNLNHKSLPDDIISEPVYDEIPFRDGSILRKDDGSLFKTIQNQEVGPSQKDDIHCLYMNTFCNTVRNSASTRF